MRNNRINLTDFILQRVYGKNESYTQAEINHLLDIIRNQGVDIFEIVTALPTVNINPHKLYLVYNNGGEGGNLFDVFLYLNGRWEQLDGLSFNISDYYTSTQLDNLLSDKVNFQQYNQTVNSLTTVRDNLTNLYRNLTAFNEVLIGFDEENTNLGDDLTRLKDNLQGFLTRVTGLINELNNVENNVTRLEGGLDNFEVRLDGFVDDMDDFNDTLISFDVKLTNLNDGLENTKTVLNDTKSSLETTKGSLNNLTDRVDDLDEGLDDLTDNKFPSLTNQLTNTNTTLGETRSNLSNLTTKVGGLENDLNDLEDANSDLSSKLNKLKDEDLHDLTESLTNTNNTLSNVSDLADTTQSELTSLQSTTNTLSVNLNKLKDEDLAELTESLNTTNQNLGTVSTLANNTKNEVTQLQTANNTLSNNLNKLKNEDIKNLNDSLTSTNATLSSVSDLADSTDSALTSLTNQFNITKGNLTQTNNRLDTLWEELSDLGVDVGDLDTRLSSFVHDLGLFSTYLTDFEGDLNDFKNQVDVSDLEYFDSLDNHLLNLFGSIGTLQQDVTGINRDIESVQEDIGDVQGELYGVDDDGKPLSVSDYSEDSLKGNIDSTQNEISSTNQTINNIQNNVIGSDEKVGTLRYGIKEAKKSANDAMDKAQDVENTIGDEHTEGTVLYDIKSTNDQIDYINTDVIGADDKEGTLLYGIRVAQDSADESMTKANNVEKTINDEVNPAISDVNDEVSKVNQLIGEEGTSDTTTLRGAISQAQSDANDSMDKALIVESTINDEVNPAITTVTKIVETVHEDVKGKELFSDKGLSTNSTNWTNTLNATVSRGAEYTTVTHSNNTNLGGYYKNITVQTQSIEFDVKLYNTNKTTLLGLRNNNTELVSVTNNDLELSANTWYHIRVIIDGKNILIYVNTVQKLIKTLETENYNNFILCCGNANGVKVDFKEFGIYDNGLLNQTQIAQNNIDEAKEQIDGSLNRIQDTEDGIRAVNQLIGEEGTTDTTTIRGAITNAQTTATNSLNKIGDVNSTDPTTAFGAINQNLDDIKDVQLEMYGDDGTGNPLPPTAVEHPEGSVFGGIHKLVTDIGSVDDPNSIKGMIGDYDKPDSLKGIIGTSDSTDSTNLRGSLNNTISTLNEMKEYVQGETIFEDEGISTHFRNWTGTTQCSVSRGAEYSTITHSNDTNRGGYHQNIPLTNQNIELDVQFTNNSINPCICLRKDTTVLNDFTLTEIETPINTWVHLNIILDENLIIIYKNNTQIISEKITDEYNNIQLCCGNANNIKVYFKNMIIRSGGLINQSTIVQEDITTVQNGIQTVHDGINSIGVELYGADSNGKALPPKDKSPNSTMAHIDDAITNVGGLQQTLYKGITDGTTTNPGTTDNPADNTVMRDIININKINEAITKALNSIFTLSPFFNDGTILIYVTNGNIDTQEINRMKNDYGFNTDEIEYVCKSHNGTLYKRNGSSWSNLTYIDEQNYEDLFSGNSVVFACATLSSSGMDNTWTTPTSPFSFPRWANCLYEISTDKFYILKTLGD